MKGGKNISSSLASHSTGETRHSDIMNKHKNVLYPARANVKQINRIKKIVAVFIILLYVLNLFINILNARKGLISYI